MACTLEIYEEVSSLGHYVHTSSITFMWTILITFISSEVVAVANDAIAWDPWPLLYACILRTYIDPVQSIIVCIFLFAAVASNWPTSLA